MAATPAFTDETDYRAYLHVLGRAASRHHLSILAYSLQPTEAHLVVLPVSPATLSRTLAQVNREYSLWRHIRSEQSERIWSGRFQSCAFDRPKLWAAIRFLESRPAPHSSRNMHHSGEDPARLLDLALWAEVYGPARWVCFAGLTDRPFESALTAAVVSGQPLLEPVQTKAAAR